ncbi:MAG TPA: glycosyltransferase [Thermoanaerobaculia bacterium]
MRTVELPDSAPLAEYEAWTHLVGEVRALRADAHRLTAELAGRRVWMVNSTETGGGVAEMLPKMIALMRALGLETHWAVLETREPRFFAVTKRLHNLIHDLGDPSFDDADREIYARVNRENFQKFAKLLHPSDVVIVHDPQPALLGALVRRELGNTFVWRCHIGLDKATERTNAAWSFLRPHLEEADHAVFSAADYIPDFLKGRSSIIHPAIDPLSPKNREFSPRKVQGILCNARLATEYAPVLYPPYGSPALRLSPAGEWRPANELDEIGLLFRPIVTQISRWDRLKGFEPLLEAFVRLKRKASSRGLSDLHRRRLQIMRLILAGPDPRSVEDDPEGKELLGELTARFLALSPEVQKDIALIVLPMESRAENAYMVNAIQRCSTVVVQNSIQEGFGLTVTEAMWKRVAVVGSSAVGIRQQIRNGVDGVLVSDPRNVEELAATLDQILHDPLRRGHLAGNAQQRVYDEFLVFAQVRSWLRTLVSVTRGAQVRREARVNAEERPRAGRTSA